MSDRDEPRKPREPAGDDERLRGAFAHLKASDRRREPAFEASRRAPKVRPIRAAWLVAGPLVAAAAVLFVVCGLPASNDDDRPIFANAPPVPAPQTIPADRFATTGPAPLPLDFLLDDTFLSANATRSFLAHAPDFDSDFSKGSVR